MGIKYPGIQIQIKEVLTADLLIPEFHHPARGRQKPRIKGGAVWIHLL
jgi:hypothetical protein